MHLPSKASKVGFKVSKREALVQISQAYHYIDKNNGYGVDPSKSKMKLYLEPCRSPVRIPKSYNNFSNYHSITSKEHRRMAVSDHNFYHNPSKWSHSEIQGRKGYNQFIPNQKHYTVENNLDESSNSNLDQTDDIIKRWESKIDSLEYLKKSKTNYKRQWNSTPETMVKMGRPSSVK